MGGIFVIFEHRKTSSLVQRLCSRKNKINLCTHIVTSNIYIIYIQKILKSIHKHIPMDKICKYCIYCLRNKQYMEEVQKGKSLRSVSMWLYVSMKKQVITCITKRGDGLYCSKNKDKKAHFSVQRTEKKKLRWILRFLCDHKIYNGHSHKSKGDKYLLSPNNNSKFCCTLSHNNTKQVKTHPC